MVCTLRCNMILEDGQFYNRGTVLDLAQIPIQWRGEEYIAQGKVDIDQISEVDEIEIDEGLNIEDDASPMQEMKLNQPKRRLVKRK